MKKHTVLELGKVKNEEGEIFIIKDLNYPIIGLLDYWSYRVNLYTLDDKWVYTAHVDTLKNI